MKTQTHWILTHLSEFEVNPQNKNEYRCLLCEAYSLAGNPSSWIQKKGWDRHKKSQIHQESVAQRHKNQSTTGLLELGLDEAQFLDLGEAPLMQDAPQIREPHRLADNQQDIAPGELTIWNDFDSG
jgi:hypothetical protein